MRLFHSTSHSYVIFSPWCFQKAILRKHVADGTTNVEDSFNDGEPPTCETVHPVSMLLNSFNFKTTIVTDNIIIHSLRDLCTGFQISLNLAPYEYCSTCSDKNKPNVSLKFFVKMYILNYWSEILNQHSSKYSEFKCTYL